MLAKRSADDGASSSARLRVEAGLREAIAGSALTPGTRISDRFVCERFGASRTIAREAMRLLEAEGLVSVTPHRGAVVAALSADEAWQVYEARAALEGAAAEGFALRASDDERARLRAEFERIAAFRENDGSETLLDAKQRFYAILLAGSRNGCVAKLLSQILNRIRQLRAVSLSAPGRVPGMSRELEAMVSAVERRDGEGARDAAIAHVREAGRVALRILNARERAELGRAPTSKRRRPRAAAAEDTA